MARKASSLLKTGAGIVICLERGADLHVAQLMPLPLTVSCFSKIQIGFTFLVPAHPGSPKKGAIKRVCLCYYYPRLEMCSGQGAVAVPLTIKVTVSLESHLPRVTVWDIFTIPSVGMVF